MKTREELITELAAEITAQWGITSRCKQSCMECVGYSSCSLGHAAAGAIDAGYRKQSDTVREFVEKTEEVALQMRYEASRVYQGRNQSKAQFAFGEKNAIENLMEQINALAAEYGAEVEQ